MIDQLIKRCRFPDRDVLDCAVSGGADSLALLALAARHSETTQARVVAHHVDHNLQPGDHARAVVEVATGRLGAELVTYSLVVGDGPNLEMRARQERYKAMPEGVLTGHTLDDQAETVLLQMMRGAGPKGLAAIDPENRPILSLRRNETVELCAQLGLETFSDPTNSDSRFRRNRTRNELLPLLNDIAERDVAVLLDRVATQQRGLSEMLERQAEGVDPTDSKALSVIEPAVAITAFQRWWRAVTGIDYSPDSAAIDRVLDVIHHRSAATDVAQGWRLERTEGKLRLVGPISSTPPNGN